VCLGADIISAINNPKLSLHHYAPCYYYILERAQITTLGYHNTAEKETDEPSVQQQRIVWNCFTKDSSCLFFFTLAKKIFRGAIIQSTRTLQQWKGKLNDNG